MTRKALARRVPAPRRKTKRSWRWCVKGGTVTAAFSKRGRVALVATTAAHPSAKALRKRYPRRTSAGRGLVRAAPRSTRVFGVRGGKVRYTAVAARGTIARRALLRRYLRAAGLR